MSDLSMPDLSMSEDRRIVIIVDPALSPGFLANTVAVLGIGLGAAQPGFGNVTLTDAANRSVKNSADRPVPVLQANALQIGALLLRALPAPEDGVVVPFPAYARSLHSFPEYEAQFPSRDLSVERIEGLGLAGPARWVKSLTGSLRLLR